MAKTKFLVSTFIQWLDLVISYDKITVRTKKVICHQVSVMGGCENLA